MLFLCRHTRCVVGGGKFNRGPFYSAVRVAQQNAILEIFALTNEKLSQLSVDTNY